MRPIPLAQRDNILSLLSSGYSTRDIQKKTGVGRTTVSRISKEYQVDKENSVGGRPRKLSPADRCSVLIIVKTGKAANAVEATKQLNSTITTPVTVQTIRNVLKEDGLKAYVKKKKPLLTTRHRKARLEFAQKYSEWTVEDWKRVIWSDETKINRFGSDGLQYVWKKPGQPLSDREITPTLKFGGGNIMVWGCMGWEGVGILSEVEGRMDAKQYVDILKGGLDRSIEKLGMEKEETIFQQDNDPKHTSKLATNWFETEGIQLLDWPAQSPDLNPIEHLWHLLKKKVQAHETPAKGVWELWDKTAEGWDEIRPEECQRLIESMPRRLQAVIKAKGGHTKY
jgi:transposase